jgi:hypothetical protein
MISTRRFKRNLKRFMIPFETAFLWVFGPLGLAFYWLWHGAVQGMRFMAILLTHGRI